MKISKKDLQGMILEVISEIDVSQTSLGILSQIPGGKEITKSTRDRFKDIATTVKADIAKEKEVEKEKASKLTTQELLKILLQALKISISDIFVSDEERKSGSKLTEKMQKVTKRRSIKKYQAAGLTPGNIMKGAGNWWVAASPEGSVRKYTDKQSALSWTGQGGTKELSPSPSPSRRISAGRLKKRRKLKLLLSVVNDLAEMNFKLDTSDESRKTVRRVGKWIAASRDPSGGEIFDQKEIETIIAVLSNISSLNLQIVKPGGRGPALGIPGPGIEKRGQPRRAHGPEPPPKSSKPSFMSRLKNIFKENQNE